MLNLSICQLMFTICISNKYIHVQWSVLCKMQFSFHFFIFLVFLNIFFLVSVMQFFYFLFIFFILLVFLYMQALFAG